MKEKIGIEKLVMLLDIYEEEIVGVHSVGEHITEKDEAWIISKQFGFIKWLVENDKIDYERVRKGENSDSRWDFETIQPEYFMIMLLSVQDNPIDFLISILK